MLTTHEGQAMGQFKQKLFRMSHQTGFHCSAHMAGMVWAAKRWFT